MKRKDYPCNCWDRRTQVGADYEIRDVAQKLLRVLEEGKEQHVCSCGAIYRKTEEKDTFRLLGYTRFRTTRELTGTDD